MGHFPLCVLSLLRRPAHMRCFLLPVQPTQILCTVLHSNICETGLPGYIYLYRERNKRSIYEWNAYRREQKEAGEPVSSSVC